VPDGAIVCPSCVIEASDRELRARQLRALHRVSTDGGYLVTRKTPRGVHVQMFGTDQGYCGEPFAGAHKRGYAQLHELQAGKFCARCCSEIVALVKESTA